MWSETDFNFHLRNIYSCDKHLSGYIYLSSRGRAINTLACLRWTLITWRFDSLVVFCFPSFSFFLCVRFAITNAPVQTADHIQLIRLQPEDMIKTDDESRLERDISPLSYLCCKLNKCRTNQAAGKVCVLTNNQLINGENYYLLQFCSKKIKKNKEKAFQSRKQGTEVNKNQTNTLHIWGFTTGSPHHTKMCLHRIYSSG